MVVSVLSHWVGIACRRLRFKIDDIFYNNEYSIFTVHVIEIMNASGCNCVSFLHQCFGYLLLYLYLKIFFTLFWLKYLDSMIIH